jgi:hypothetical protein
MGHNLVSYKGKNFVAWILPVLLLAKLFAKSCHEKITFILLYFIFCFGFAQDKLTYQRFRVSRKSTTNTQTKETPLTAEDVAEFKV